jgi:hypothetical protein
MTLHWLDETQTNPSQEGDTQSGENSA